MSFASRAALLAAVLLVPGNTASAIVWRDDVSEDQVIALAQQGQFAGTGLSTSRLGNGTGVAIAPGWILAARHVVGNGEGSAFVLGGNVYFGQSISQDGSDVALIKLNADSQLPANTPFITPNLPQQAGNHNAVGNLVWKVGRGVSGSVSQDPKTPAGGTQRAGTNIISSRDDIPLFFNDTGSALRFGNSNTTPGSTDFEVSTGPGDSGGPLFLQSNNQWFVAGTTIGFTENNPNPFVEADVAAVHDWILSEIRKEQPGFNFTTQAAPTSLTFDTDFTTPGVQDTTPTNAQGAPIAGFDRIWNLQRPMFEANGFNYTWENDANSVAVFGTSTTLAGPVAVESDIAFGGIRFDPTASSNPFEIIGFGGSLRGSSDAAFIEANTLGVISAPLTGGNDITKTGDGELILSGNNASFDGQLDIAEGKVTVTAANNLGTGGFFGRNRTTVRSGATLELRGAGMTSDEHIRLTGDGLDGQGALRVRTGNHTLTERIAALDDTTISVDAGASLTIGSGDPSANGGFFQGPGGPKAVTQAGEGMVVYGNINEISSLSVINGVAAGSGGINGTFSLTTGAELRPGDSASAMGIGEFTTGDFLIDDQSLLTLDLDPESMLADLVNVNGTINLDGNLALNLLSAPSDGDQFQILENDGIDSVIGLFANGNQVSAVFGGQSYDFAINYAAGTGNDVFLSFTTAIPEPSTFALLSLAAIGTASRRRRR
jgi:autotransporter-associated beta strand protein